MSSSYHITVFQSCDCSGEGGVRTASAARHIISNNNEWRRSNRECSSINSHHVGGQFAIWVNQGWNDLVRASCTGGICNSVKDHRDVVAASQASNCSGERGIWITVESAGINRGYHKRGSLRL